MVFQNMPTVFNCCQNVPLDVIHFDVSQPSLTPAASFCIVYAVATPETH